MKHSRTMETWRCHWRRDGTRVTLYAVCVSGLQGWMGGWAARGGLTWLRKVADGLVVVDNEGGRGVRGAVLFGEGGERTLSFTPLLQQAAANRDGSLKRLTLRWPPAPVLWFRGTCARPPPPYPTLQPLPSDSNHQCNPPTQHTHTDTNCTVM